MLSTQSAEDVLRREMARPDARSHVVPVLGAGVSRPFGLPLGMELATRLFKAAQPLIRSRGIELVVQPRAMPGFYDLMQSISGALEQPQWVALVQNELQSHPIDQLDPARWDHVRAILQWRPRRLLTTNLDRVLEHALDWLQIPYRVRVVDERVPGGLFELSAAASPAASDGARGDGASADAPIEIVKLHGDIDHPPSWVLTRDDYQRYTQSDVVQNTIRGLAVDRSCVFVGYSLADEDVLRPIEALVWRAEASRPHFVLLGRREQEPTLSPGLHRIGALPVVWEAGPGYSRFHRLLKDLFSPQSDKSRFVRHYATALAAIRRAFPRQSATPEPVRLEGPRPLLGALLLVAREEFDLPPGVVELHVERLSAYERRDLADGVDHRMGFLRLGGSDGRSARDKVRVPVDWPDDPEEWAPLARLAHARMKTARAQWPFVHQLVAAVVMAELGLAGPDFVRVRGLVRELLRDALAQPLEERAVLLWELVNARHLTLDAAAMAELLREARPLASRLALRPAGTTWRRRAPVLARMHAMGLRHSGRLEEAISVLYHAGAELDAVLLQEREAPASDTLELTLVRGSLSLDEAQLLRMRGEPARAHALLHQVREALSAITGAHGGDTPGSPASSQLFAVSLEEARLRYDEGRAQDALALLLETAGRIESYRGIDDPTADRWWRWNAVSVLHLSAQIHVELGDIVSARRDLAALQSLPTNELPAIMARAYPALVEGIVREAEGQIEAARRAYQRAEELFDVYGFSGGAMTAMQRRLALALADQPFFSPEEVRRLDTATSAAIDMALRPEAVRAVASSAQALLAARHPERAQRLLNDLRRRLGRRPLDALPPHLCAALLFVEGDTALELGDLEQADRAFHEAEAIQVPAVGNADTAVPIFTTMPVRQAELVERRARMARLRGEYTEAEAEYAQLRRDANRENAVTLEVKALLALAELRKSGVLPFDASADPLRPLDEAETYVSQALTRLDALRNGDTSSLPMREPDVRRLVLQALVLRGGLAREKGMRIASQAEGRAEDLRARDRYRSEAQKVFSRIIDDEEALELSPSVVGKAWLGLGGLRVERATDEDNDDQLELDELAPVTHLFERGIELCLRGGAAAHAVQELSFVVYLWFRESKEATAPWERRIAQETISRLIQVVVCSPQLQSVLSSVEGAAFLRIAQCYGALTEHDFERAASFLDEATELRSGMTRLEAADDFIREAAQVLREEKQRAACEATNDNGDERADELLRRWPRIVYEADTD